MAEIKWQLTQERSTKAKTEVQSHLDGKANLVGGLERDILFKI
jgi:hypothetical protein